MISKGLSHGDKICIMSGNCPQFVEAAIALAKLGIAWVPVNYRFKENEVAFLAKDADAKGFIVDAARAKLVGNVISSVQNMTPDKSRWVTGAFLPVDGGFMAIREWAV